MVIVMVYTLRDFGGLTAALQKAANNGAFVAILTDVDEVKENTKHRAPRLTDCPCSESDCWRAWFQRS